MLYVLPMYYYENKYIINEQFYSGTIVIVICNIIIYNHLLVLTITSITSYALSPGYYTTTTTTTTTLHQ